jgi:hypothetical protein
MAPDSPNIASLFDFLYVDGSRLAAFAAQLSNKGILQTTETVDSTAGKSGGGLEAGVPKVLNLNIAGGSATVSSIKQQFDASWSLPLNVLDLLDEGEYIAPDIAETRLGQIFLVKGVLRFMDYRLLKDCWEHIAPITIQGAQETKGSPLKHGEKANMQNLFKLVQKLPHSVELIIHSGDRMYGPVLIQRIC